MKPPYTINNNILNLSADIMHIIGGLEVQSKLDLKLRKTNRIKSIHSSLAIENNSLTLEQITAIIDGKRVLGDPKEISEVKNAYEIYNEILKLNPYSIEDFLYAHSLLTKGIVSESGKFRSSDVGVYANNKVIHMGARPQFIQGLVEELFTWCEKDEIHALIKSCIVHYEIENIHPFEDGNGRMGRLWQTVILSNWNELFAWLPIETIIHENQEEYYKVLRESDSEGESTIFIEFMLKTILTTLKEYKQVDGLGELNKEERRIYEMICGYLKEHNYITTNEASELTKKAPSTLRRYFAKYIELGLIESVGENKNKRYCLQL